MLSTGAAIGSYVGTIVFFIFLTFFGIYSHKSLRKGSSDAEDVHLRAPNSQGPLALSLSFFASGAGAWALFTVPEAAILGGPIAVAGYTLSCMIPLAIFGCIGPYFRRNLPEACTFFDYVQARYGTFVNVYCTLVTLFYLFLYLSAELTSVGSCITSLSELESPLGPIIATSLATLAYTAVGGLPLSLLTDKVQGVGVFVFSVLVCIAGFCFYTSPTSEEAGEVVNANWEMVTSWGLGGSAGNSVQMAIILISAVTSAAMMHAGFQQRIWAADGDGAILSGAVGGALLTMPFMVLFGVLGMFSFAHFGIPGLVAVGPDGDYLAFLAAFFLVGAMAPIWQALAIMLAVMMVASSADTIQTGVAALLKPITERVLEQFAPGMTVNAEGRMSRALLGVNLLLAVVLVNIPAIALAMAGVSVLSLFVLADLVCATAVGPLLLGLSPHTHPVAAGAGCVGSLALAFIIFGVGVGSENTDAETGEMKPMKMMFQPGGLYSQTSLVAFLVVPAASFLICLLVNIPYRMNGYKFGGFKTATTAGEDQAPPKADGPAKEVEPAVGSVQA